MSARYVIQHLRDRKSLPELCGKIERFTLERRAVHLDFDFHQISCKQHIAVAVFHPESAEVIARNAEIAVCVHFHAFARGNAFHINIVIGKLLAAELHGADIGNGVLLVAVHVLHEIFGKRRFKRLRLRYTVDRHGEDHARMKLVVSSSAVFHGMRREVEPARFAHVVFRSSCGDHVGVGIRAHFKRLAVHPNLDRNPVESARLAENVGHLIGKRRSSLEGFSRALGEFVLIQAVFAVSAADHKPVACVHFDKESRKPRREVAPIRIVRRELRVEIAAQAELQEVETVVGVECRSDGNVEQEAHLFRIDFAPFVGGAVIVHELDARDDVPVFFVVLALHVGAEMVGIEGKQALAFVARDFDYHRFRHGIAEHIEHGIRHRVRADGAEDIIETAQNLPFAAFERNRNVFGVVDAVDRRNDRRQRDALPHFGGKFALLARKDDHGRRRLFGGSNRKITVNERLVSAVIGYGVHDLIEARAFGRERVAL